MSKIKASNLSIEFPVYGTSAQSLKNNALNFLTGGVLAANANDIVVVKALNNINVEWNTGDRIGIVGNNGSGKTTLLRALSGAYYPTSGSLDIQGKVASMLSITLGMEGDATGLENIKFRGTLMGLNKNQINDLIDEVIEFSELENYIYMPMRTYSTGMMMRLAFGISTSIKSDILLMDEWLSVGDVSFTAKAEDRLVKLVENAKILVIASHSSALIEKLCNKVLHLDRGFDVSQK